MSAYPPEKAGHSGSRALPTRTAADTMSDDDAVPDFDPTDVKYNTESADVRY